MLAALALTGCVALVLAGAAIQVAVGAGLSVVCGPFLLLWLGPAAGVPVLLALNLLVSVVATAFGLEGVRWGDAALASLATLAGCLVASALPSFSDATLKAMTAAILVAAALPPPPRLDAAPASGAALGVALASLVTGALTVWTATPGPVTPVALARAGRSGADIRQTMQPISVVGYGAALAWVGGSRTMAPGGAILALLVGATLAGAALGFALRRRIDPDRVVLLVRVVAAAAAALLVGSLLRA